MASRLTIEDLRVGDVMLFAGKLFVPGGWQSGLIALLDGGPYSHAALYVGERDGKPQIVEAGRAGVFYTPIRERIESEALADAFRWHGPGGEELGSAAFPVEPIVERGQHYIDAGTRYAYSELFYVALLLVAKKALHEPRNVRLIMAAAFELLNKWREDGREPLVCSELVYRCYLEAGDKYRIDANEVFLKAAAADFEIADVSKDEIRDWVDQLDADVSPAAIDRVSDRVDSRKVLIDLLNELVIADFVSPYSLKTASNLTLVGSLK